MIRDWSYCPGDGSQLQVSRHGSAQEPIIRFAASFEDDESGEGWVLVGVPLEEAERLARLILGQERFGD